MSMLHQIIIIQVIYAVLVSVLKCFARCQRYKHNAHIYIYIFSSSFRAFFNVEVSLQSTFFSFLFSFRLLYFTRVFAILLYSLLIRFVCSAVVAFVCLLFAVACFVLRFLFLFCFLTLFSGRGWGVSGVLFVFTFFSMHSFYFHLKTTTKFKLFSPVHSQMFLKDIFDWQPRSAWWLVGLQIGYMIYLKIGEISSAYAAQLLIFFIPHH